MKTFRCSLVALLLFMGACSTAPRPAPTAVPSPSQIATRTSLNPTITPSPNPTAEAINPLLKAVEALKAVSSVRIQTTNTDRSASGSRKISLMSDVRYLLGPPEQFQVHLDWGDGLVEDMVCFGREQGRYCWSRVGQHPWTVRTDMEWTPGLLEQAQLDVAASTIISSTILTETKQMIVAWRRPFTSGVEPAQGFIIGKTWLQAESFLPIRKMATVFTLNQLPLYSSEDIYLEYNQPVAFEAPVAATVTPVPTLQITPWTPSRDLTTHEEDLPFPGVMISPDSPGSFPAVIVLHGSEGSIRYSKDVAITLAQKGYVTIALCYYGCPDTPAKLENIAIESVTKAVDFVKGRPNVRRGAVAVLGLSRGAELALIVGSLDQDVHAVISVMGVPWVVGGFPDGGTAWLYQGRPLPFRNIPVEQINGPVLVIHGERDLVWPVDSSYLIADRLAEHRHPFELAVYSDRGHNIGVSPLDAMNRILAFLKKEFP